MKICRDDPSRNVYNIKGCVGTRHPFRWGKETHSPNSICCKQQQGRCKNYSCNLRDRRPPITTYDAALTSALVVEGATIACFFIALPAYIITNPEFDRLFFVNPPKSESLYQ
ncbi:hypothetical protein TNCV_3464291 [Trichonephila clavipes]|nr:hypothetical protein TNCV_3464291 [Trichonephila clavipes]